MKIMLGMIAGIIVGLFFQGSEGFFAPDTLNTWIKPFGTLFLNLIKFVVVPVVFFSLVTGIVNLGDLKKLGSIGGKTLLFYLCTSIIALSLGFTVSLIFKGFYPVLETVDLEYTANTVDITTTLLGLFPANIVAPFANADMLPLIVIAISVGLGILAVGEAGLPLAKVIESGNHVFLKIMLFIVGLSPYGVFALMAPVVAVNGPQIFTGLGMVLLGAYIAYILHMGITYSLSVKLLGGISPMKFFKGMVPAMVMAFSSSSSLCSLPINIQCAKSLGLREHIVNFALPLGANINSDGTAIYQSLAAVFIASCYGIELTIMQMLMIIVTATLASFGIAGVPGAGMVMLAMVLASVGLPIEGIAIVAGIDRLFDMGRTTLNVVGDVVGVVVVDNLEKRREARLMKAS